MKIPKIMRALGFVDDELIEEAADQTAETPDSMKDEITETDAVMIDSATTEAAADAATIESEAETATIEVTEETGNAKTAATEETGNAKAAATEETMQQGVHKSRFSGKRRRWTTAVAAAAVLALIIGSVGYAHSIGESGESSQSAVNDMDAESYENDGAASSLANDEDTQSAIENEDTQSTIDYDDTEGLEGSDDPFVVVAAKYPAITVKNSGYTKHYPDNYSTFVDDLSKTMLTQDPDSNQVYSPLNIYMALAMLAESTGGNSRDQIMQVLGNDDMDSLRTQANSLWNGNYRNKDNQTTLLGSSLWLNQNLTYNTDTVKTLAEKYYASVFQGELGSEEFTNEMVNWINEQTGNLLQEQTKELLEEQSEDLTDDVSGDEQEDYENVVNLVTTIYYKAKWLQVFSEEMTSTATFHGVSQDTECDFMNQTIDETVYYEGEQFGAIFKGFSDGGGMWLILPDEDSSVSELLEGEEMYSLLDTSNTIAVNYTPEWENSRDVKLNLSMPKFDITSSWNLKESLALLGITDVFDVEAADLSALTQEETYISKIVHAARIIVDEQGIEATAYTEVEGDSSSNPPADDLEEIDFVLDRPFVYAVVSDTGTVLFVGTVNQL